MDSQQHQQRSGSSTGGAASGTGHIDVPSASSAWKSGVGGGWKVQDAGRSSWGADRMDGGWDEHTGSNSMRPNMFQVPSATASLPTPTLSRLDDLYRQKFGNHLQQEKIYQAPEGWGIPSSNDPMREIVCNAEFVRRSFPIESATHQIPALSSPQQGGHDHTAAWVTSNAMAPTNNHNPMSHFVDAQFPNQQPSNPYTNSLFPRRPQDGGGAAQRSPYTNTPYDQLAHSTAPPTAPYSSNPFSFSYPGATTSYPHAPALHDPAQPLPESSNQQQQSSGGASNSTADQQFLSRVSGYNPTQQVHTIGMVTPAYLQQQQQDTQQGWERLMSAANASKPLAPSASSEFVVHSSSHLHQQQHDPSTQHQLHHHPEWTSFQNAGHHAPSQHWEGSPSASNRSLSRSPEPHRENAATESLGSAGSSSGTQKTEQAAASSKKKPPKKAKTDPKLKKIVSSSEGGERKLVLACHFCRGRKLKCDGLRPTCTHCSKRNLTCSYDTTIRRRGPGKKRLEKDAQAKREAEAKAAAATAHPPGSHVA